MSDHWHYASDIHGGAEEHHRHYDTESAVRELQSLVAGLREDLGRAEEHIRELESQTPAALRSQRELDETLADNATAGYGPDEW